MPFTFDHSTRKISMPPGDTGDIYVTVNWDTGDKDVAVIFAVVTQTTNADVQIKTVEVQNGYAHIRLCNHDTRDLRPGKYYWQLRLVTSPAKDSAGNIIADECTDDVVSVFNGDALPEFILERNGARV